MTTEVAPRQARKATTFLLRPGVIVLLGVILVPIGIVVASIERDGAPGGDGYIRMAFAAVAAATVAICTAAALLIVSIARRSRRDITRYATLFALVLSAALTTITAQADQLLRALG